VGGKGNPPKPGHDGSLSSQELGDLRKELGKTDLSAVRMTLADLCDRHMATVQHQKKMTIQAKLAGIHRVKLSWTGGGSRQGRLREGHRKLIG